ncbi:hypothetical protein VTH06DRAFT_3455, partial [Thermothelomyces fergusii]
MHAHGHHMTASGPDQDRSIHPPGQMVTNPALAHGLGSTVVTVEAGRHLGPTPPEAVSGTVRHLPKEGIEIAADTTEAAQEPGRGLAAPDTAESEARRTEAAAKGFSTTPDTAAETSCSRRSPAIAGANDTGSDEEEDDLVAAIRYRRRKDSRLGRGTAQPLPSGQPGSSATNNTTRTNGEDSQRKLPILDEVIDLTSAPDNEEQAPHLSPHHRAKKHRSDKHGRERKRAPKHDRSQASDDVKRDEKRSRGRRKRREKESARHRRRSERQEEHKERAKHRRPQGGHEEEALLKSARSIQETSGQQAPREHPGASSRQPTLQDARHPGTRPEQGSPPGLELALRPGNSPKANPERLRHQRTMDATKNRQPGAAGDSESTRLQDDSAGRKPATSDGPLSPTASAGDDAALFQALAAKVPEKRTARVVTGLSDGDVRPGRGAGLPGAQGRQAGSSSSSSLLSPLADSKSKTNRQVGQLLPRCRNVLHQPDQPQRPPRRAARPRTDISTRRDTVPPPPPPDYGPGARGAAAVPPRETVPAAEALGPDRTVVR